MEAQATLGDCFTAACSKTVYLNAGGVIPPSVVFIVEWAGQWQTLCGAAVVGELVLLDRVNNKQG
jgi:hypothetical protein